VDTVDYDYGIAFSSAFLLQQISINIGISQISTISTSRFSTKQIGLQLWFGGKQRFSGVTSFQGIVLVNK
jgi:hypothetical protein